MQCVNGVAKFDDPGRCFRDVLIGETSGCKSSLNFNDFSGTVSLPHSD